MNISFDGDFYFLDLPYSGFLLRADLEHEFIKIKKLSRVDCNL